MIIKKAATPLSSVSTKRTLMLQRGNLKKKLWNKINQFHDRLEEIGFKTTSTSQIIPIIIGKEKNALEFSKFLMSKGIFAQAIRYPTVKKNHARIRVSISGWLSEKEIERSIEVLEKAKKKFHLKN